MTSKLLKLAALSTTLGLAAVATAQDLDRWAGQDTPQDKCVCSCKWAKDLGPWPTGTYTFAAPNGQSCPAMIVGNDVPCRDDKGVMHVSAGHFDCQFVPAVLPRSTAR